MGCLVWDIESVFVQEVCALRMIFPGFDGRSGLSLSLSLSFSLSVAGWGDSYRGTSFRVTNTDFVILQFTITIVHEVQLQLPTWIFSEVIAGTLTKSETDFDHRESDPAWNYIRPPPLCPHVWPNVMFQGRAVGGVYLEALRGRNFIRPPPPYTPHP